MSILQNLKQKINPLKTDSYDYYLPQNLIAKHPANPLDSAKLLVYNRIEDKIYHDVFSNVLKYIPKNTEIILNDTKVIKARVYGHKSSGGKIELLINRPLQNHRFSVYIKGRVRVDSILEFDNKLSAKVIELLSDGSRVVEFYHDNRSIDFSRLIEILDSIGHTPLPPYINRDDTKDDEELYQSIFAKKNGAVAAPTASLHFTPELFDNLKTEYNISYITLHVGAGTFKSVESDNILEHKMHSEYYEIPSKTKSILDSNSKILAIGTTVTRTIEYYDRVKKENGECDLFLNPSNLPQRVDYLLTNFHLPKSTLIMLVSSFIGQHKTMQIYQEAIKNQYRFFSYGDAMLII